MKGKTGWDVKSIDGVKFLKPNNPIKPNIFHYRYHSADTKIQTRDQLSCRDKTISY